MTFSKKNIWRLSMAAAGAVIVAGLAAPWLDAGRFGNRVTRSLERALGRRVEHGGVHLNLFTGPGFSVDNVVIYDEAGKSAEPFAYVEQLEARVSVWSLWGGRLEFSNLRLVSPSLNFTKAEGAHWNFEPLLTRTVGAAQQGARRLPDIQVRDGRINFKFGDTKSIFYLTDMEIDAQPPASPSGAWRVRMEGQPARTDRSSYGFGVFKARGNWWPDARTGGRVNFNLDLVESSLAEWIRLVHGREVGVHGEVSSRARIAGPLSDIEVSGVTHIGDIHRWDLPVPRTPGWDVNFHGRADLIAQTLELDSVPPAGGGEQTVECRVRASGYLTNPRWAASMTLRDAPLAPLAPLARQMGAGLPEDLTVDGKISGMLAYVPRAGLEGALAASPAALWVTGSKPVTFDGVRIVVDGSSIYLAPAALKSGTVRAKIEGDYSWRTDTLSGTVTGDATNIAKPLAPADDWAAAIPFFAGIEKGVWSGKLRYRQETGRAGTWSGDLNIKDARIPLDGFADPLEVAAAHVVLDDKAVALDHMAASIGGIGFKGEYQYKPAAERQHRFHISIAKLEGGALEAALLPALDRNEGFFARALRLGRTKLPDWLEGRRAEGTVEVGSMTLGGERLERVRAHVRWDGGNVEATEVAAKLEGGAVEGHISASLGHAAPSYKVNARFRGVRWMGGQWEGKTALETFGTGVVLFHNLRAEGTFKSRTATFAEDAGFESVSGNYAYTVARGVPQFRFSQIRAVVGGGIYEGQGTSGADGRIHFDLSDGEKRMRMNGTLSPFQLTPVTEKDPG